MHQRFPPSAMMIFFGRPPRWEYMPELGNNLAPELSTRPPRALNNAVSGFGIQCSIFRTTGASSFQLDRFQSVQRKAMMIAAFKEYENALF
jgi:hypothetical protein